MAEFTGTVAIKVLRAEEIKPTAYIKRLPGINVNTLDTYVEINVDDRSIGKTTVKAKTLKPVWNEDFNVQVYSKLHSVFTIYNIHTTPLFNK